MPQGPPPGSEPARSRSQTPVTRPRRHGRRGPAHPRRCTDRCRAAAGLKGPNPAIAGPARTTAGRRLRSVRLAEHVAPHRFPASFETSHQGANRPRPGRRARRNVRAARRPRSRRQPAPLSVLPRMCPPTPRPRLPSRCSTTAPAATPRRLPRARRPCPPACRPGRRRPRSNAPHESRARWIPPTTAAIRRPRSSPMRPGSCLSAHAGPRTERRPGPVALVRP